MAAFVYLLRCSDGSFYVGSTRDLDERVHEHVGEAFGREKQVQGWGRARR